MQRIPKPKALLIAALMAAATLPATAQTYLETFGQNRVQYRTFDWKFFETEHFRIYHYDRAGRQLARYLSEQAEKDIRLVEERLGGQFPRRFNIILYNNYDEFRQTNVGRKYDSQLQDIPAGTVNLVGDRLVVYYTGEHVDLRRQLRTGMSRVVMERMLFGESFREMVRNAVLLNLPAWTTDGFIAYLVDGWDTKTDNDWKNLLAARPRAGFFELAEQYPELAGKAFWKYAFEKHGESTMKTLLYTMQLKSSLNQAMKMTLGMKVQEVYADCMNFYKEIYDKDRLAREQPDTSRALIHIDVPTDNTVIRSVRVSPRGQDVAYVAWKEGEYKVYLQRTTGDKRQSLILSGGRKDFNELQPDPDYPILAWSNNGYKLAILYKKGTETRIRIYNSLRAKIENYVIPANRFDRVLGLSFMEHDDKLVFSAIKKSQTDLYEFTIRGSRMKPITNDLWDDVQPWFVSGGSRRGILFLSNRPRPNLEVPIAVNELPTGPMNVFFYDTRTQSTELLQVSHVKRGRISQPIQYGSDNFAFLYDSSGVQNRYVVVFGRNSRNEDSAIAVPMTNYHESIVSHQYNPASNEVGDVLQQGGEYRVYFRPLELPQPADTPRTLVPSTLTEKAGQSRSSRRGPMSRLSGAAGTTMPARDRVPVIRRGNTFQSEFSQAADTAAPAAVTAPPARQQLVPEPEESIVYATDSLALLPDSTYFLLRGKPYRLSFKPDFFTVRVDNSVLFNRYQPVAFSGGSYTNPSLGGMLTVSLNDVMENHRFTGGLRLPVNFSGLTYFLQYENFKRRIDWGILYLRSENYYNYLVTYADSAGRPLFQQEQLAKVATNLLQGSATYPLDRIRSIRATMGLRQDVMNWKAQDTFSLTFSPRQNQYWLMNRLEYVFDNSTSPALNIRNGFRYKFFGEYLYKLSEGNGGFYNLGVDFRYYHKIYKNFIWASRLAGAHSAGNQRILYFLGGVDNWISPQYNNNLQPNSDQPYAFQAMATNLRGYKQNDRNGNTYAVFNGELRLPVLATFVKRPIQSGILKHLQAIGFVDAGAAWNGLLPNADNMNRDYVLYQPPNPVVLTIKNPAGGGLALGYGAGLRSMLMGYFMRLDAAWNIDGRRKPIMYFSIGTDF